MFVWIVCRIEVLKLNHKVIVWQILLPQRGFHPEGEIQGGTLVTRVFQLKYTVSMPEKQKSIYLNRGCMESLGNDDISIVRARK